MKRAKVSVVIERDENGYYAYAPQLKGCHSQGESFQEVLQNIREAIELYLETLSDEELKKIVQSEVFATSVEVEVEREVA